MTCSAYLFPDMMEPLKVLPQQVIRMSRTSDVYKVWISTNESGNWVFVKVLRVTSDDLLVQATQREIIINYCLDVASMPEGYNVCSAYFREVEIGGCIVPAIISEWYENVLEYVLRNPHVNKLRLIQDLAATLSSLHSAGIVHGNIHPGNVMVTPNGRVLVADVGFNHRTEQLTLGRVPIPDKWAYMPPEGAISITAAADTYVFAVTVYTIVNEEPPFRGLNSSRGLRQIIRHGHSRLQIPPGMSQPLWEVLGQCWERDPSARPGMEDVSHVLRSLPHL